jgi:hypothetical protein
MLEPQWSPTAASATAHEEESCAPTTRREVERALIIAGLAWGRPVAVRIYERPTEPLTRRLDRRVALYGCCCALERACLQH